MAADESSADELQSALREYEKLLEIRHRLTPTQGNIQQINASVQAGSAVLIAILLGVALVAATCCGVSIGMVLSIQRDLARSEQDAREIRDYVQTLYRQIPELRKLSEKEQSK